MQAFSQIEVLLRRLDNRSASNRNGELCVIYPTPDWEDLLAIDAIRIYGALSLQVMRRLRPLLIGLQEIVPPNCLEPIRIQRQLDEDSIEDSLYAYADTGRSVAARPFGDRPVAE